MLELKRGFCSGAKIMLHICSGCIVVRRVGAMPRSSTAVHRSPGDARHRNGDGQKWHC
jgi:hypothetical protein